MKVKVPFIKKVKKINSVKDITKQKDKHRGQEIYTLQHVFP